MILFTVTAGLSFVLGVLRVPNVAHGSLYMIGAFSAYSISSLLGGGSKAVLVPEWEYRIYLRPHPDATTGLLYDAGNRMPPHVKVPPYYVCWMKENAAGDFDCQGLSTIWQLEKDQGTGTIEGLASKFGDILSKFGGGPK